MMCKKHGLVLTNLCMNKCYALFSTRLPRKNNESCCDGGDLNLQEGVNIMLERRKIHLGAHGEDYGNWMSNPVFYMVGGVTVLAAVLAILSFAVFVIPILAFLFMLIAAAFLAILVWIAWIRWQYSFSGGRIMERVYQTILPYMDYDGKGTLLEIGCGSGALSIYAALTWPETKVIGVDYWGAIYHYTQSICEKNALTEGVADRCEFRHGDANTLDFPNESVDAVVSNYVYHNIMGADNLREVL